MDTEAEVTFRPHNGEDMPFLHDSWGSSYYRGTIAGKSLTPEEFHSFHRPIRERFFSKPNTCVIVCAPTEDPWMICGWIAIEKIASGLILHYLYVRSSFKKQGIAEQLLKRALPTAPVFFTHLTERAARIMSKKQEHFESFKHIPHLI